MKRTIVLVLGLVIALAIFFSNYHKVYGNCHTTIDGTICSLLKWERNK